VLPNKWHFLHDVLADSWYVGEEEEGEDSSNTAKSAKCHAQSCGSLQRPATNVRWDLVFRAVGRFIGSIAGSSSSYVRHAAAAYVISHDVYRAITCGGEVQLLLGCCWTLMRAELGGSELAGKRVLCLGPQGTNSE